MISTCNSQLSCFFHFFHQLSHLVWPEEVEVLVCLDVEDGGLGARAGAIGRLEPGQIYMVEVQRSFQNMTTHVTTWLILPELCKKSNHHDCQAECQIEFWGCLSCHTCFHSHPTPQQQIVSNLSGFSVSIDRHKYWTPPTGPLKMQALDNSWPYSWLMCESVLEVAIYINQQAWVIVGDENGRSGIERLRWTPSLASASVPDHFILSQNPSSSHFALFIVWP